MHVFYLNVWCAIACVVRWGVALVGIFLCWALLTSSRDPLFMYREFIGRQRSDEAVIVKKADMWP